MEGALQIGGALVAAGFGVLEIADALVSEEVYPMLVALQLGTVMLDPTLFPKLTPAELEAALSAPQKYTADEIERAVAELFARPHRVGPVGGGGSYYRPPEAFDDLAYALQVGQPVRGFNVRAGDVVDAIQVLYGSATAPQHGGGGGKAFEVRFASGDVLVEIAGHVGPWFGATYIQQLLFKTRSGIVFGPFGSVSAGAIPFTFRAAAGQAIVALFGQVVLAQRSNAPDSLLVNQLGCYVKNV